MRQRQIADGKKITANLCLGIGQFIMHHTGIINDYIAGANDLPPVSDQILAGSAIYDADFHMFCVRMQNARICTDFRPNLSHIIQLRLCFGWNVRTHRLLNKMLQHKPFLLFISILYRSRENFQNLAVFHQSN